MDHGHSCCFAWGKTRGHDLMVVIQKIADFHVGGVKLFSLFDGASYWIPTRNGCVRHTDSPAPHHSQPQLVPPGSPLGIGFLVRISRRSRTVLEQLPSSGTRGPATPPSAYRNT